MNTESSAPSGQVDRVVMPRTLRLKKDWPWFVELRPPHQHEPQVSVLRAGEVGTFFDHSGVYTFQARDNWVPFIPRVVLERLVEWWEAA